MRMIDQIRASKLPSNMMQFAARGALQVPASENIEILVHLALHNKVFADLARMTLAGWDEKACLAVVSDPKTPQEVLNYFISQDNLRPKLLPALLENPSVPEGQIAKLAMSAMRETLEVLMASSRVRSLGSVVAVIKTNPYLKKEEVEGLSKRAGIAPERVAQDSPSSPAPPPAAQSSAPAGAPATGNAIASTETAEAPESVVAGDASHEAAVSTYMQEHSTEIAAEGDKPFQAIGGIVELLGAEYFPVTQSEEIPAPVVSTPVAKSAAAGATTATKPAALPQNTGPERKNALQKINSLDVKGRIQLALKGNKEERSLLIRDGTKVVALAVLEAPKLSDGEVEKFASQKNVLEAVLRQIPLKRRFVKNYIVVRNLVANPRTPLDLGLGLMKNLLIGDLKNLSSNKEVSETIRKLATKMYKQKLDDSRKK